MRDPCHSHPFIVFVHTSQDNLQAVEWVDIWVTVSSISEMHLWILLISIIFWNYIVIIQTEIRQHSFNLSQQWKHEGAYLSLTDVVFQVVTFSNKIIQWERYSQIIGRNNQTSLSNPCCKEKSYDMLQINWHTARCMSNPLTPPELVVCYGMLSL